MNSTESSPVSTATPQTPEQAAQDALSWWQGLKRLLTMVTIDSFVDSFAWEKDEMAAQSTLDRQSLTGGATAASNANKSEADMRNMVAGNMTVEHHYHDAQTGQPTSGVQVAPTAPVASKSWLAPLAGVLVGGAIAGGAPAVYNYLSGDSTTPISTPTADTPPDWKLGVDVLDRTE